MTASSRSRSNGAVDIGCQSSTLALCPSPGGGGLDLDHGSRRGPASSEGQLVAREEEREARNTFSLFLLSSPFSFLSSRFSPLSEPGQKEPDIAGNAVGKFENAGDEVEPAGTQLTLPAKVELGRFAAQRRRPLRIGGIDGAAPVAA